MGAQDVSSRLGPALLCSLRREAHLSKAIMGKPLNRSEIAGAIEKKSGVAKKSVKAVLESLGNLIPGQLKSAGKFTIPGLTMIKLRKKPATKAGKRMAFGKMMHVKAKPARTIVKCYTVKALKDEF